MTGTPVISLYDVGVDLGVIPDMVGESVRKWMCRGVPPLFYEHAMSYESLTLVYLPE